MSRKIKNQIEINRFIVLDDTMVIVHYSTRSILDGPRGSFIPTLPSMTIYDKDLVKLAKYTGNVNLHIPATMHGSRIKVDFKKSFAGKDEYLVSEVMNS
jgi:hypothetical protein